MMDLIGLPLTSTILFILAGLLIGHALWHRDRSADVEKIHWLEKRYLQARRVARLRRQEQRHLRKQRDDQQYEVGTIRQRLESNMVQMKALERKGEAATEELESVRGQLQEATEQIRQEQRRNDMLVTQLQEVLKSQSSLEQQAKQQQERWLQLADRLKTEAPELATRLGGLLEANDESEPSSADSNNPCEQSAADASSTDTVCPREQPDPGSARQQPAPTGDMLSQQAVKLVNVREQLEELLPLRAESAESTLTIAEQRLELAAQQEEIQRLRDQGTGFDSNRRAA